MTIKELACNYSRGQQQALSNKYPQKDTFRKKKIHTCEAKAYDKPGNKAIYWEISSWNCQVKIKIPLWK